MPFKEFILEFSVFLFRFVHALVSLTKVLTGKGTCCRDLLQRHAAETIPIDSFRLLSPISACQKGTAVSLQSNGNYIN